MLAIRGGRPETLTLRDIIESFVNFREEVITRRAKFELAKARDRAHLLLGLVIAVTNLDEVVRIIRGSASPAEARAALIAREWPIAEIAPYIALVEAVEDVQAGDGYRLSDAQVRAILDLRLHRLTALGRDEIAGELRKLATSIARPARNPRRPGQALRGDARGVRRDRRRSMPRRARTEIAPAWDGIEDEDLIEREDMVVTVTLGGYIKRTPLETFRTQKRGGKGRAGMATKDEDAVTESVRDLDPHAGPVLLDPRQGLSAQGLAPSRRRAAGARPADGQPAAAGRGRDDLDRPAAARGRGGMGQAPRHVRHRQGLGAAQFDGRLRQHPHLAARSRCASTRARTTG